ncbi:outer membrane beta-barrel protein [uncultured Tenacibaculum sp.]|uniref:outer membrane beta-barrel protein n=1 Tax=uncultured Tenacibaculum sp. TaxID=174713 RepID=UPI00261F4F23|nr:outer membrane beta-barrel protein [uncultured Tenacibaculum sp.]
MKKTRLLLIALTFTIIINGQTLKIQGGTSISKLNWKLSGINDNPFYNETLIGYSIFAGLNYLEKQYFNLSSNIGMIRKGGKDEIQLTDQFGEFTGQTVTEKPSLDYLSINTTIDFKYKIKERLSPFISFGPRFDYLVNSSKHFESLENINELKRTSLGLIFGGGLKYDISNFQLGLRADYYLDFTKVANWETESSPNGGEVTVDTFTINLTIGYRFK